jgi:transcriptional regulator with XRE-family HTH domain
MGERIKQLRKSKRITQEELAVRVNRSKNHISKIETGVANPPVSLIFDIAVALDVTPDVLFMPDFVSDVALNANTHKPQSLDEIQGVDEFDWNSAISNITNPHRKHLLQTILHLCIDEEIL